MNGRRSAGPARPPSFIALAGVCLLLSAIFIAVLLELAAAPYRGDARRGAAAAVTWTGGELRPVEGRARRSGRRLEITGPSARGRVVLSSGRVQIDAAAFPYLEWSMQGHAPDVEVLFFWRPEGTEQLHTQRLAWSGDGSSTTRIGGNEDWLGEVSELGLAFRGEFPRPVRVARLALRPPSPGAGLRSLVHDWMSFEGWTQRSTHFLVLGARGAWIPLTVFVALWIGVAALLYGVVALFDRRLLGLGVPAVILLCGWLVLDARWMTETLRQADVTYRKYGGKTWAEKNSAAYDGDLYAFVQRVKGALPREPCRIFFLSDKQGVPEEYERERARYHLVPHNVYAYPYRWGLLNGVRPGDYVLAMGGDRAAANRRVMRWVKRSGVSLELVYGEERGRLYRRKSG